MHIRHFLFDFLTNTTLASHNGYFTSLMNPASSKACTCSSTSRTTALAGVARDDMLAKVAADARAGKVDEMHDLPWCRKYEGGRVVKDS